MDPDKPDIQISDVVISIQGRDQGELFYVIGLPLGPKQKKFELSVSLLAPSLPDMSMATGTP